MEMTTDMLAPELFLAPSAPAEINPLALLTIKPEEYVAQVFAPFRTKLATLKAGADTIHFKDDRMFDAPHRYVDISTTEGMAIAVKYRAALRREVRLDAEDARATRKAPILLIGKLLDSTYKAIAEEVAPYEEKFDGAIKAEEKRKADVAAAKARAEAERIGGIKTAIEAIRTLPARAEGKSADELRALLERVAARSITKEEFAEFIEDAQIAMDAAGRDLVAMFGAAQQREAIEAEAEAARIAEAERLAAEQSAADQRRADEAAENARVAAENQRVADELAAAAQKLADQQATIDRQRAELEEAQAAAQAEKEVAEQARVAAATKAQMEAQAAQITAERQANERATVHDSAAIADAMIGATAQSMITGLGAMIVEISEHGVRAAAVDLLEHGRMTDLADEQTSMAPATPPTLRLGQIGDRLGFTVTADFVLSLGFAPAATDKAAKLYHESSFPSICAAIQRHIIAVQTKYSA